jgi:hypothetical protein
MDEREPMSLKDLPEPLRTFAYYAMACSHMNFQAPFEVTAEDNPYIHPEVIFSDWNELNETIKTFLEKVKETK